VWVAAAACVVAGAGNGAAAVCNATLVQRGTPDRLRGRVFTIVMSANYLCFAPGMIVAGLVENTFGPRWLWGGAAALLAVAAVVARALARGVSIDEQAQDAAPAGGLGDPALQATEPAL
jgi:MFS family permease